MIRKLLLSAALLGASLGGASAATLFSDDFESYTLGTPASLSPTWTIAPGTIDVIGAGNGYNWWGLGKYVDMNGSPTGPAKIQTSAIALTIGKWYELSFNYGYNRNSGTDEQLTFGVGTNTGVLNAADFAALSAPTFGTATLKFQATSALASIFFHDTGPTVNDAGGPVIDNVTLSPVPLPAAAPLLLAGLGGLALLRRRRKA